MHKIVIEPFDFNQNHNLQSWFASVQHIPGSVLLHSGDSDHENARFHIATTAPILTLNVDAFGKITKLYQKGTSDDATASLMKQLQPVLENPGSGADIIRLADKAQKILFGEHEFSDTHLPFLLGGIGYSAYDFGRFLEVLPEDAENPYHNPVFSISFYPWSLVTDTETDKTWLCYSERYGKPDIQTLPGCSGAEEFRLCNDWQSNMTKPEYMEKLDAIHEYLLAGDCYQVNLAQRFQAQYKGCEWQAWQALQEANQSPFSAFIRGENSCILSVSPERFLASEQGDIETKPIKGTRPRFQDPNEDARSRQELLSSEKDRAENLMIVDLLRNDLSKNARPHSVKVEKLFQIESFQAVHHLVSTITAKLKSGISPLTLMKDAFPGGSITGAPKVRAMEVIDELEPQRRNIYCGSIFYIGVQDDFDSNICIRTLLLEGKNIYCWAGGGIVADSQAEMEYEETFHKVNKILPVLQNTGNQTIK